MMFILNGGLTKNSMENVNYVFNFVNFIDITSKNLVFYSFFF